MHAWRIVSVAGSCPSSLQPAPAPCILHPTLARCRSSLVHFGCFFRIRKLVWFVSLLLVLPCLWQTPWFFSKCLLSSVMLPCWYGRSFFPPENTIQTLGFTYTTNMWDWSNTDKVTIAIDKCVIHALFYTLGVEYYSTLSYYTEQNSVMFSSRVSVLFSISWYCGSTEWYWTWFSST
jgi:hypothetical protein